MAFLAIDSARIRIETSDDALDRVKRELEQAASGRGGLWLAGQLQVERNGETTYPDPANGHQRLWVPAGTLVALVYDRPLSPDPDRLDDEPGTVIV